MKKIINFGEADKAIDETKEFQAFPFNGNYPKIMPNSELPSFQGGANPKSSDMPDFDRCYRR
jgi:hypothetical protein